MDESSFGIHEVELVVESGEGFGNGGRVVQHTDGTLHFGQVTSGDDGGWLVIDPNLERNVN